MIELYQQVFLTQDFPEYHLKKGDLATFIDTVPHPAGGEEGFILEIFNVFGGSIDVVTVPKSAIAELKSNQIFSARSFSEVA